MKETIRLYLILTVLSKSASAFSSAIYSVFLLDKGLSLAEISMVNAAFYITIVFFEIPTGLIADTYGRKKSYLIACILWTVGLSLYGCATTFWHCVLVEVFLGIGLTFSSGAFESWCVDRLREQGHKGPLTNLFQKQIMYSHAAMIASALCGAWIAQKNLRLPWFIGGGIMLVVCIVATLWMKETRKSQKTHVSKMSSIRVAKYSLITMKRRITASYRFAHKSRAFLFVGCIGALHALTFSAPNMQWQPYFQSFFPAEFSLGIIKGGISVALIIGAAVSHRMISTRTSVPTVLLGLTVVTGMGIGLSVFSEYGLIALSPFLVHEIARGAFDPIKKDYLNQHLPSNSRATLLSGESMFRMFGGAIGLVLSGFVAEHCSIPCAWIGSGVILVLGSLLLFRWLPSR